MKKELTHEYLLEMLHYDSISGHFWWKKTRSHKKSGSLAGSHDKSNGYIFICINKYPYLAHRLAWFYVHGKWPDNQIHHVNRNRCDNRIRNLQDVTMEVNLSFRDHKSGAVVIPMPAPVWIPEKVSKVLTQDFLKSILNYNQDNGDFTWKINRTNIPAGKKADYINNNGYIYISISVGGHKRRYAAHRLAYLYMESTWPENEVDHINGNRADNRWCNLRKANRSQNSANTKRQSNKTGLPGVHKKRKKWTSTFYSDGKRIHLGVFGTPEDAYEAYKKAKIKHCGEFARVA